MSARNFARKFSDELGLPPARFVGPLNSMERALARTRSRADLAWPA